MIFECSAIILIILMMAIFTWASGKKSGWIIGMLPLIIVPAGHVTAIWIYKFAASLFNITPVTAWIGIDLFMLMLTCLLLGVISLGIKSSKPRLIYLILCGSYSAILTCVLIVRSVLIV